MVYLRLNRARHARKRPGSLGGEQRLVWFKGAATDMCLCLCMDVVVWTHVGLEMATPR